MDFIGLPAVIVAGLFLLKGDIRSFFLVGVVYPGRLCMNILGILSGQTIKVDGNRPM